MQIMRGNRFVFSSARSGAALWTRARNALVARGILRPGWRSRSNASQNRFRIGLMRTRRMRAMARATIGRRVMYRQMFGPARPRTRR